MSQHVSTQYWIVRLVPLWRFQPCSLLLLRVMVPKTGVRLTWAFHLWEPWIRLQSLWVSVDAASIPSPLESRPLSIFVGSFPRWYVGLTRVSPTDVHILFYHSDVTVISENRENSIVDSEMIARDPEWQHIAVAVTFEQAMNISSVSSVTERLYLRRIARVLQATLLNSSPRL